ncbi:hypothetical protein ACIQUG_09760 [Ensifer sp. NPDC090286]|uniref:hypothetical protein n=1 Tax=Ensifer sp. NPDC090286 TaxID=3363991 RepID=UPI00383B0DEA
MQPIKILQRSRVFRRVAAAGRFASWFGKIAGTSRREISDLTSAISSLDLRGDRRLVPVARHHLLSDFSQETAP